MSAHTRPGRVGRVLPPAPVLPSWLLTGSAGLWVSDCLVGGCLWTFTASTPEAADTAGHDHACTDHADLIEEADQ